MAPTGTNVLASLSDEVLNTAFPIPDKNFTWIGYRRDSIVVGIRSLSPYRKGNAPGNAWQVWVHYDLANSGRWLVRSYGTLRIYTDSIEEALPVCYAQFLMGDYK